MEKSRGVLDSLFDFAESVVGGAERVTTGRVHGEAAPPAPPSHDLRIVDVKASRWKIVEAIDEHDGAEIWIVTNGTEQAECSSRALAERIYAALR